MTCGYLYIAIGEMFLYEAARSAKSLKRFTQFPVALVTDNKDFTSPHFDQIIRAENLGRSFEVKITGMQLSPYERTVFLDTDTFVCAPIDNLFDILEYFDMAMTLDPHGHAKNFWEQYQPTYEVKLKGVFHEFHTGVIAYNLNNEMKDFFKVWHDVHLQLDMRNDMPTLREAFLKHPIKVCILPLEYNLQGIKSMAIVHNKVRVIHERLGTKWNNLRPHMASFEYMDRLAKRINKKTIKRLIVPYIGVIPYNFSPFYIIQKLKRMLGVKVKKKREGTFVIKD